MLFAALELWDFVFIGIMILVLSGGSAATVTRLQSTDRRRLKRMEAKIDQLMNAQGLTVPDLGDEDWQKLALDPSKKIAAIKAYREATGAGLAEAKDAVEKYIAGQG
jgi:ribosomal protein L7/L12